MRKRCMAILLVIALMFTMAVPVFAATDATLSASDTTITAGESVTFTATATTGNNSGTTLTIYFNETDRTTGGTQIAQSSSLKQGAKVTVTFKADFTPTKSGYYYATASDNQVATSQTVYVRVDEPQTYTVTYDANGGENAPVDATNYIAGTTATLLDAGDMVREGYTFSGWQNGFNFYKAGDKITVTKDITLSAMWTKEIVVTPVEAYKVTYNANGAKGDVPVDNTNYTAGTTATILDQGTLNLQGFTFLGWNTAANGRGTSYEVGESISINANFTLFAQWKQNIYHITYDANGGTNAPVDTMDYYGMIFGQAAAQGSLIREGYSFTGWNTAAAGNGTAYKAGDWVSANDNVTLYAQWTANTYTVTFDYKGVAGEVVSKEVTFDSAYGVLPEPAIRDGYLFRGWSLDGTVSMKSAVTANTIVSIASDHTLTALWASDVSKAYNITYDGNGAKGGTVPVDTMNYVGMVFGQAAGQGSLVREGYSFTGWNTAADGSGTAYKAGDWVSANGNVTLYAQWTANTYTVTFDYKGVAGEVVSKEVTFDSAYGVLPEPAPRDGYLFRGWSLDGTVSMKSAVTANTIVSIASDHTLTALWASDVSKAYNITYDGNGATDGAVPVDTMNYVGMVFGQAAAQGSLIREGYSFAGWNTAANGNDTSYQPSDWVSANGNVTLYAQWKENKIEIVDVVVKKDGVFVTKQNGNTNLLTITVTVMYSNGTQKDITNTLSIKNNAKGTYEIKDSNTVLCKVYVATSGNTKIDSCYIVK